jgi:hypothetical protein
MLTKAWVLHRCVTPGGGLLAPYIMPTITQTIHSCDTYINYAIPSLQVLAAVCRHKEHFPVRTRCSHLLSVDHFSSREAVESIHGSHQPHHHDWRPNNPCWSSRAPLLDALPKPSSSQPFLHVEIDAETTWMSVIRASIAHGEKPHRKRAGPLSSRHPRLGRPAEGRTQPVRPECGPFMLGRYGNRDTSDDNSVYTPFHKEWTICVWTISSKRQFRNGRQCVRSHWTILT